MSLGDVHSSQEIGHPDDEVTVPSRDSQPSVSLESMRNSVSMACTARMPSYDCSSIEKWLEDDCHYSSSNCTTPPSHLISLRSKDLPVDYNQILQSQLIQARCAAKESVEVERIPTPLDRHRAKALLKDAKRDDAIVRVDALRKLQEKAKESTRNRRCIVEARGVSVLTSVLSSRCKVEDMETCDLAVGTLSLLQVYDGAKKIMAAEGSRLLSCLSWIVSNGSSDAKINTAVVLMNLASMSDMAHKVGGTAGIIEALVELLRGDLKHGKAVKAALRALSAITTSSKNRKRVVEKGAVSILVEMLPSAGICVSEQILVLLQSLCKCAEGRKAVMEHALAISTITKKMCLLTFAAAEASITILWALFRFCGHEESVHERAVEAGLFAKLLLLMQADLASTAKNRISEILGLMRNVCTAQISSYQFKPSTGRKYLES